MKVLLQSFLPDARCIFMDLQLELLPYHYYNILGFGAELIDYIDHVNDSVVLEKIAPLYKDGGRPPIDPRAGDLEVLVTLMAAKIAAFLFYGIKFLSKPNDKNFIPFPILTRTLSHSRRVIRKKVSSVKI
jgi:hypothetical protein